MAGIDNASKFRSKEDEERLRRQKAKAPTNVKRAKELAQQYSNPYKFNNTVTVTKRIDNEKWYSGDKPTGRETYARIYQVAGDDQNKLKELQGQWAEEISNPGSVIYNPYAQATNTKAINGLRELGIDVPDKITDQWVDKMWSQYGQYGRQTTTSYGPSAPTTKSTRENDIAYWVGTLMEDKENTNLAEAQMKSLYDEVAYLTKQGYSDNEIVKRVRNEFGSKYNVLNKMDEERMVGSAVRLNRAVDYSGDDTLYGMIWAARNDGGTGDYFNDSINYAMGNGKKYKADPTSEAALDPSNAEGYNPYGRGGTMHELNMKYGLTGVDSAWLEANRSWLNDPEKADDWRDLAKGVENSDAATTELMALDQQLEKWVSSGKSMEDIEAELRALIADGGEVRYTDADGKRQTVKLSTLSKMEEKRALGTFLEMGYGVDFTLPNYIAKASDMVAERDAAAATQVQEEEEKWYNKLAGWFSDKGSDVSRFLATLDIGVGSHGDVIDSVLDAEHGSMSTDDMLKKYASNELGVELIGDLTDGEREIVENVLAQVEAATDFGSTDEERDAAAAGIAVLQQLVDQIAADPERRDNYKANESYTSVYERQPEEPREGMAPMAAEPTAYTGADGQPVDPYSMPEAQAYEKMLQGGEWDTNAFGWGYSISNNPEAVEAELVDGILGIFNGQKPTGLGKSWYNEFSGLMNNTNKAVQRTGLSQGERDVHAVNPELYDSRHAYGTQVYDALMANQKALDDGAIHPVDYVKNLVVISAAAEAIGEAAGGARATDEQAAEVLAANNGELQALVDSVNSVCAQGQEAKAAAEAEVQQKIIGVVDAYAAGEQLDAKSETVMNSILSMDVSKAAADDSTYQDISAQVKDNLSMDNLLRNGMTFTTGSFENDMLMDHADLQQSGALAYGQGVMMVVEDMLDEDMRLASACGMSLGEYYEAHPERARSSEQLMTEAQTRYETTWNEFGKTISGLLAANQSLEGEEEEAKISTVESLSLKDTIGVIADKFGIQLEADLRKTGHFLSYAWRDQGQKKNALMQQYGNDRTAYAADLNELEKEELTRLQGVYDADATKGDMQFDEWTGQHAEGAHLRELRAMREANVDIFDIGMTVDEIRSGWGIEDVSGTMVNIDALVAEHGSDTDKFIYESGASLLNTGVMMAVTAATGGGYIGSLASTAASAGASAHDRYQQTGNFDAALWSSVAEWGVNALIEKVGFDRYMPENIGGGNLATKIMHSKYILANQNLMQIVRSPESMSKVARGIFASGVQAVTDMGSEFLEEFSQGIVSAMADNFAYSKPYLLTAGQIGEAAKEGVMAMATAPILSLASGNKLSFSDITGNLVDSAKALLLPEHDGAILNASIDFQSTRLAIQNSQDALSQIEQSSENVAKKQAGEELAAANAELTDAQTELATVQSQQEAAGAALDAANAEMNSGAPFTEELGKRMTAAADNVNKIKEHLAKVQQRVQAAAEHQAEAQQKYEDAKAAVQKMYDELMQTAKAEAEQMVTDLFFGGDSEAQRAAMDRYRAACQKLMDAKENLRIARADTEMFARGTAQGDGLFTYYGEALLEVEALTEEVAAAKAEVDAAYAETGEAQMQAQQNADLTAAEEAAALAAEKAAASPSNQSLQAQAELAQAQLNTIRAKQTLDEKRTDIGKRLQSPRSTDREAAVQEWKELQQVANDAVAEADRLQAEVDTTDTQKNLRSAIDNMKQYSNMDLMDENSVNHEAAVEAYNELLVAEDAVRIENAQRAMDEAYANMDASKPETVEAYREARKQYNFAIDNGNSMNYTNNGEVYENESKGLYGEDVLRTSGFEGEGSGSGASVRGASAVSLYGDRRATGRQDARGDRGGRRIDGSVRYESTTGLADATATPEVFVQALADAKAARPEDGHQVSPKEVTDITEGGMRPFLTSDQLAGFGIDPNGNITGVFKNPASKLRRVMDDMMLTAIQEGGDRLDCYAGDLFNTEASASQRVGTLVNKYAKYGFEPVAVVKYNAKYAESDKVQDIVFFIHNGKSAAEIQADLANGDYEQYSPEQLLALKQFGPEDYEAAMQYRDSLIEQRKPSIRAWRDTGAGFGDHRGPGRTGEVTTADRNPIEIMSDLTRSIQAGYNPGGEMSAGGRRMPRAVMAFYNHHAQSITSHTSEAGDLAISLHEFGHAVQDRLPGIHANQQLINNLPQDVRNAYDPAEWDGEALAEFVVDYIFNRDEAVRMAGDQFVRDFEDVLRADRPLYNAIIDASHQTELWNNADPESRMDAMIKNYSVDPRRHEIGNWLSRQLRKLDTGLFDYTAPAKLVSRDFHRQALYSAHARKRSDVVLNQRLIDPSGRDIGQSLAERLYDAGVGEADMNAIVRYSLARHALDRRAQNKDVFDEHEFPTAELQQYVADVEANNPNIVAGADALTSFWSDFMDAWMVDTGLIDRATIENMRAMYPHYVPTFRVVGENFNDFGGRRSTFQLREAVEGGSSLEVINPMISLVDQVQKVVNTVTNNQLMRAFHREMQRGGMGEIARLVPQREVARHTDINRAMAAFNTVVQGSNVDPDAVENMVRELAALEQRFIATGQGAGTNVVSGVDEYGNRFFYEIYDRPLFNLMSGSVHVVSSVPESVRHFKNTFTALTTGSNPLFALRNAQRDFQASVNTGTWALTYADGMAKWIWALTEVFGNSESYQRWKAMGGGSHSRFQSAMIDPADANKVARQVAQALLRGRRTLRGNFKVNETALNKVAQLVTMEKLNTAIEDASRFAEWRFGRHDLNTEEGRMEAFMRSQDVTTNFGTHGAYGWIQTLNKFVPFMNATLQGTSKDIHIVADLFGTDAATRVEALPKASKIIMNNALVAAFQMMLLKHFFTGEEDDEDYALLNDAMKAGNLIIPIPQGVRENLEEFSGFSKPYIRIPLAQGTLHQGMYAVFLDSFANVADYSPLEVDLMTTVMQIAAEGVPTDGTIFQAIMDAKNNKTWYGKAIESSYMQQGSEYNRYKEGTSQAVINLARAIGTSPAKLDYLLNQYSGIVGKVASPLLSGEGTKGLLNNVLSAYTIDPVDSNDLSDNFTAAMELIDQTVTDGKPTHEG